MDTPLDTNVTTEDDIPSHQPLTTQLSALSAGNLGHRGSRMWGPRMVTSEVHPRDDQDNGQRLDASELVVHDAPPQNEDGSPNRETNPHERTRPVAHPGHSEELHLMGTGYLERCRKRT